MSRVVIGFKTSPQGVDWPVLDETWAAAGELPAFEAAWLNDHLTDPLVDRAARAWSRWRVAAALAHHVPGRWIGVAVLSNTFRQPAVLAKQATALDLITGGRFILGLGAGWHEGEHDAFGIPLRRSASGSRGSSRRSGSSAPWAPSKRRRRPGSASTIRWYPLRDALNLPPPTRPADRRSGSAANAHGGSGWRPRWPTAGSCRRPGTKAWTSSAIGAGRSCARWTRSDATPSRFDFGGQLPAGETAAERALALDTARRFIAAGATHIILGMPARLGPTGLAAVSREVAEPLRAELG